MTEVTDRKFWVSPSQIKTFRMCEHKWYCDKILGLRGRIGSPLTFGSSIDATCNKWAEHSMAAKPFPMDEAEAFFVDDWKVRHEETEEWKKDTYEGLEDTGRKIVAAMAADAWPLFTPAAIQTELRVPIAGRSYGFIGYLDMRTTRNEIVDWKTAKAKWSASAAHAEIQWPAYGAAWSALNDNALPERGVYVIGTKTKTPAIQIIRTPGYSVPLFQGFWRQFRAFADRMESHHEIQNPRGAPPTPGWQCASCGAREQCRDLWGGTW